MEKSIIIEWNCGKPEGKIAIVNGKLKECLIIYGKGTCKGEGAICFEDDNPCRIRLTFEEIDVSYSKKATIVAINLKENPFSFFLRDVSKAYPIFIPAYNVVVTDADDGRTYSEIRDSINAKGLRTSLQHIGSEKEESFEGAAAQTRKMRCQTWLGLSRDMRLFGIGFRADEGEWGDWIQPRYHGHEVGLPENDGQPVRYYYMMGRGIGSKANVHRFLEEGFLPILKGTVLDEGVNYHFTAFVTLEKSELNLNTLRGTHYLVADSFGHYYMHTDEQKRNRESLLDNEINRDEETVLYFRAEAANDSGIPKYAWFKSPTPQKGYLRVESTYEETSGFGCFSRERVYCLSRLNGNAMNQEETAVLLKPGEKAVFEFMLPHRPIPYERAILLAAQSFEKRLLGCINFWKSKLNGCADLRIPESHMNNAIKAGLLHLDIVAYGHEPAGTVAPTIGVYCPIGSESAPIIQFMDSMGWHDLAKRSIMYFLDKQHEDGFMQNFGGYMLETGAVLWSMGEHYRYTLDDEWLETVREKLLKSCDYILQWRNSNKREELRDKGYGMMEGKVADPEDQYRTFMLNGYSYLGLIRAAEMLSSCDPAQSVRIKQEAEEFKADILRAFAKSMGDSPVVPLENGTWCPTAAPWVEKRGPACLYADGGLNFTHGSFVLRDSLIGPLWLVMQEVIGPYDIAADFMLSYHSDLMYSDNVAFSQPYYSVHPWLHLKRGETKAFLKAYYHAFSGLADSETYTFWEHFYNLSPHKTHEEAWFLMQTRWMLYMEDKTTLKVFPGIPRAWMEKGKSVEINKAASYFGPVTAKAEFEAGTGKIKAKVECNTDRKPQTVEIRLPHPEGRKGIRASGGEYDSDREVIRIDDFGGYAEVIVEF